MSAARRAFTNMTINHCSKASTRYEISKDITSNKEVSYFTRCYKINLFPSFIPLSRSFTSLKRCPLFDINYKVHMFVKCHFDLDCKFQMGVLEKACQSHDSQVYSQQLIVLITFRFSACRMVLVLNGVLQEECPLDTHSLFMQHPVYRDTANQLLSIPIKTVKLLVVIIMAICWIKNFSDRLARWVSCTSINVKWLQSRLMTRTFTSLDLMMQQHASSS